MISIPCCRLGWIYELIVDVCIWVGNLHQVVDKTYLFFFAIATWRMISKLCEITNYYCLPLSSWFERDFPSYF